MPLLAAADAKERNVRLTKPIVVGLLISPLMISVFAQPTGRTVAASGGGSGAAEQALIQGAEQPCWRSETDSYKFG
jgi:hypothetical protein